MAELKIDIDGINNKVIPPLNKAKAELESAANSLSAISYSPDYYKFTNRSRVQSVLPQNIRNIKTDVNNINKWLSDISSRFQEAERKSNNSVNSLFSKLDKINLSSNIGKTGSVVAGVAAQNMAIGQDNITIFAQKGFELAENIISGIRDGISNIGAKTTSIWESLYNKIIKPGVDFFEKCKAKISDFVKCLGNIFGFIGKFAFEKIESMHKSAYEKDLGLANTVILDGDKNTSLLDDPEIKAGLEQLNALLELQKSTLDENATEILNKLTQNYNPEIKEFIENFQGSLKEPGDINKMIFLLTDIKERLEVFLEDGEQGDFLYSMDTTNNPVYEWFASISGLSYTEEDWKSMQEYMKKNNLTWHDIISEYESAISELTAYNEQLIENKSAIYSLERYIDLYPYTSITTKSDFEEYLKRDYSNEIVDSVSTWQSILNMISFGLYEINASNVNVDFNELTQEEKAIYFYLKEKYSESEAQKYYESLQDLINQRKGEKQALEYIKKLDLTGLETVDGFNNFMITTGMGLGDGVWQFGENIANLFPGNGEIMSELQYKQAFLTSMLTQEIDLNEIAEKYGKNSEEYKLYEKLSRMHDLYKESLGINYNVAVSIGNEAIPMAVSLVPEVGPQLGVALSGLSSAGGAKATAYQNGVTGWNAYLYAGIEGVSSAALTKAFGAIPGLSDNASTTFKGIVKGATQARNFCCCTIKN